MNNDTVIDPSNGYVQWIENIDPDTGEPLLGLAITVDLLLADEDEFGRQVFVMPLKLDDVPTFLASLQRTGAEACEEFSRQLAKAGGSDRILECLTRCDELEEERGVDPGDELARQAILIEVAEEMGIELPDGT